MFRFRSGQPIKRKVQRTVGRTVNAAEKVQYYLWDMTESSERPRREIGIGLAESLSPQEVLKTSLEIQLPQLIQKTTFKAECEKKSAILLYHKTSVLFDLPLAAILSPSSVGEESEKALTLFERTLSSSAEKKPILAELEKQLIPLCKSTLIPDVMLVRDEILSNAIYNAPFVDQGNSRVGASRLKGEVTFGRPARFFAGHDGERLVVGCLDLYGALNVEKLIRRIESCYHTGAAANMNRSEEGGAQIGSYLVFQSCLSYYVAVEPGQRTLVAATFPLQLNRKKRETLSKNIHVFKV